MGTHFDIFDLPPAYQVDVEALDTRFRELSLRTHPDRMGKQGAAERRQTLEQAASLNEAYRVLKDPVRRAFYLLKLHGVDLDREDAGAQKDMPVELLEEVLSLREELEHAKRAQDGAKAQRMVEQVEGMRQQALKAAVASLGQLQARPDDPEALKIATQALARVRYFSRFLEEAEGLEEEMR